MAYELLTELHGNRAASFRRTNEAGDCNVNLQEAWRAKLIWEDIPPLQA